MFGFLEEAIFSPRIVYVCDLWLASVTGQNGLSGFQFYPGGYYSVSAPYLSVIRGQYSSHLMPQYRETHFHPTATTKVK
jgi:hypothetical protein